MTKGRKYPDEVRREIFRCAAEGKSHAEIAREVGIPAGSIWAIVGPLGGVIRAEDWRPSDARLSIEQRLLIWLGLQQMLPYRCIAQTVGRHASTICREVKANGGRAGYAPFKAHNAAWRRARRPKPTKLGSNAALCEHVAAELQRWLSPEQISRRLRLDFAEDPEMQVSHETIYKSLYVQGRGELRKELARCLRSGRAKRKIRGRTETRGRIPGMVMISERPAEVEDRAVPGHWEGDLIVGKNGKSAIGTLVERATRYVMLLHLPNGTSAEAVRDAMTRAILTLPESLRRTLTWDQGLELSQHLQFTVDTGVDVYFCDPHSPWQRGTNENTNGLLRQYFPKGTDLSAHDVKALEAAADSLNTRPRKTLGWLTPAEKLSEALVAATG